MTARRQTFALSSTGMLHVVGCHHAFGRVRTITEDAAARVQRRCTKCFPAPHGEWISQDERVTNAQESASRLEAAVDAANEANRLADAAHAASITPDLDDALRAFCADPSPETFAAVNVPGFNFVRRARELGLVLP